MTMSTKTTPGLVAGVDPGRVYQVRILVPRFEVKGQPYREGDLVYVTRSELNEFGHPQLPAGRRYFEQVAQADAAPSEEASAASDAPQAGEASDSAQPKPKRAGRQQGK